MAQSRDIATKNLIWNSILRRRCQGIPWANSMHMNGMSLTQRNSGTWESESWFPPARAPDSQRLKIWFPKKKIVSDVDSLVESLVWKSFSESRCLLWIASFLLSFRQHLPHFQAAATWSRGQIRHRKSKKASRDRYASRDRSSPSYPKPAKAVLFWQLLDTDPLRNSQSNSFIN